VTAAPYVAAAPYVTAARYVTAAPYVTAALITRFCLFLIIIPVHITFTVMY
jgi:hypothetical protein